MSFEERIVQAIKSVMPPNAEVVTVPSTSGISVGVSWLLADDPERPNKRSKQISIRVSHEAAQDFGSVSPNDQGACFQRVSHFLSQKLRSFDASHSAGKYENPPVEVWVITSDVVLGTAAG